MLSIPGGTTAAREDAVQFGIFDHVDASGSDPHQYYEERLALIERYDRAGFHAYFCAEHHLSPIGMVPSPSVFLAAVAQRTRRIRFGPLVYALPLFHPLRMIEEIGMLDQMSGGRLELGFGRGSSKAENAYFGLHYEDAQNTYATSLELIRDALATGEVRVPTQDGTGTELVPLTIPPRQQPHPPIWYGVHAVESAERAARAGLNLMSLDTAAETRAYADRYRAVWSETHAAGAPRPKIGISRFLVIDRDPERARAIARRAYIRWHASFNFLSRRHGYITTHARPEQFDAMVALGKAFAGTPAEVTAFALREIADAGADYFVGQFAFGDMSHTEACDSVELFAAEVMPAIARMAPEPAYR